MKKTATQISPAELFKNFYNESVEDSFIASENIKDIILINEDIGIEILHFPFRVNEVIMVLCVEGCLKGELETRSFVLEKNAVLVILPNQIFEISEMSSDFKPVVFIMKTSFWDKKDSILETTELQHFFYKENKLILPDNIMKEIIVIWQLIKDKISGKEFYRRQIIQLYINILFYNVYALIQQHNLQQSTEKPLASEYLFDQFIRLVERYFREQHDTGFYAEKMHLTSKYLSAVIRQASGKTAAQWIREYLLLEARALLKSGRMSIQQVSNELNFYDQSHFGVFFKKNTGCSPKTYQRS